MSTTLLAALLQDSPQALYRLGESSGTTMTDSTANARNGTYGGTVTLGAASLVPTDTADKATTFGGSTDAMGWVSGTWHNNTGAFAVFARIKPSFPGTLYQAIVSKYDSTISASQFVFRVDDATRKLTFVIMRGISTFAAVGATTLVAGTTYSVHATWDGTTAKVYVNGALDGSTTSAGALNSSTTNLSIGNRNTAGGAANSGDTDSKWAGTIDEVAYFSTVPSDTRIAAHHALAVGSTATYLSDAVTRADSTTVPGSPTTGGPYTAAVATWGVSSNALYTSTSTANSVLTFPSAINVDFQAVITAGTFTPNPSIMIRRVDANNFWWLCWAAATQVGLYRVVAGVQQLRAPLWTINPTLPLTLRLVGNDRVISAYANGSKFAQTEDDAYFSATVTAGLRHNSSTAVRYDDLLAIDSAAFASLGTGKIVTPVNFASAAASKAGHVLKGRDRKTLDTTTAA